MSLRARLAARSALLSIAMLLSAAASASEASAQGVCRCNNGCHAYPGQCVQGGSTGGCEAGYAPFCDNRGGSCPRTGWISCSGSCACVRIPGYDAGAPDAQAPATSLTVDFDDGTFGPLLRSYGPTDDPARADPAYTVEVRGGRAHYVAPAAAPGPRLTGFLDLPPSMMPIDTPLDVEFTLPLAGELSALGGGNAAATAIAGCYIRGGLTAGTPEWVGGTFGDYWFGFVWSGGARISAVRQGPNNLVSEPFTAVTSASYRLEKRGLELRLFASYDGAPFHAVGTPVTITLRAGGSGAVAVTHVRVLDTSGAAIDVTVDDLKWSF